jgi:hypothetical protein
MAQNAQLSGLVKDKTGAFVPQAQVTLKNLDTNALLRAKTDKTGFYIYPSVQPGKYDLSAEAKGFDITVISGIKVDTAANVSQDIMLQIKKGSESVTVVQQAGQLNTEDGTVSTVVDKTLIENMPLNGKDLTTLFELSPGTILNAGGSPSAGGGFSVDGQRPTANYLTIDGASAEAYVPSLTGANQTGASIAASASGGTVGILPIDALEEYRMDTSTYTAENGRTPGGQIQVRTRSGTNQFHGTLFENFRNQALDDTDWFTKYDGLKQTPLRMNDFGGTIGGPILKNKMFFFVANDNLILNQPETTTQEEVPDASLLQGAYPIYKTFLSAFPLGNAGQVADIPSFDYYNASYSALIRDHTTSVRLDGQLPHSIHAFFRANIAPSTSYDPGIDGDGSQVNIYTYTGGLTVPLSIHTVDELTINRTETNTHFITFVSSTGGNNPDAIQNNLPTGVSASTDYFGFGLYSPNYGAFATANVGPEAANSLHQWNIVDKLSWQVAKHNIQVGADVLTRQTMIHMESNVYLLNVGVGTAPPYSDLDNGIIDSMTYEHANADPNVSLANTSLFVNDDWKANRALTVNVGLRWEYNPPASVGPLGTLGIQGSSLSPATIQASVSNRPLYQTRYNNFAPRFGFAWSPVNEQSSSTVVRGGVGIYFDTGQAATAAGVQSGNYPYLYTENFTSPLAYGSVNWTGLAATASQKPLPVSSLYIINPYLSSPRTYEWSLTVEQQFGRDTKLSMNYVGNDGEKLVGEQQYYNALDSAGQYPVNTSLVSPDGSLYIVTNQSHSNYQALQVQLSSKMGQKLTALATYTWSHAEDNGSTDFSSIGATALNPLANSANDIRHIFAAAIHYAPRGALNNKIMRDLADGWAIDTIARLQTASPFTVTVYDPNPTGFSANADVVPGMPVLLHEHINSYDGKVVPGNKAINWAAFSSPPVDSNYNLLAQGDSPTNGYRLFGLKQWDLAINRSWRLWKSLSLNFRADAFNVVNTPNFADPDYQWSSGDASTFGIAQETYANAYGSLGTGGGQTGAQLNVFQNGGPREIQLSMKLKF